MNVFDVVKAVGLTVPLVMLSGCLNTEAPECSDEDVVGTVKNIYAELPEKNKDNPIAGMFMKTLPKSITSLESIRPVSYEENVKLRTCKAQATLENGQTIDIQYTVQSVENDSAQFYVELNTDFIENLMMTNIMNHSAN